MDRRYLRPGWLLGHALAILAVLTCLRLGWWQWDRSREAGGDAQNLGYALLWPAFGAAFIYMWVRFVSLEKHREANDEAQLQALLEQETELAARAEETPATAEPVDSVREVAVGIVGDEDIDDEELIAYNRALAALAEEERHRDR